MDAPIKVTLANITYSERMSEETECFDAVVVLDGVRAFGVRNNGTGGCHSYYPLPRQSQEDYLRHVQRLDAHCKTLPKHTSRDGFSWDQDADWLISEALADWLRRQDFKKLCRRVFVMKRGKEILELKYTKRKPDSFTPEQVARIKAEHPDMEMLNFLPFEQGFAKYMEGAE